MFIKITYTLHRHIVNHQLTATRQSPNQLAGRADIIACTCMSPFQGHGHMIKFRGAKMKCAKGYVPIGMTGWHWRGIRGNY